MNAKRRAQEKKRRKAQCRLCGIELSFTEWIRLSDICFACERNRMDKTEERVRRES